MTDAPGRVLMVSSLWPPVAIGGAERYAAELAGHLKARGWDVGVLTLGVDGADVVTQVRPVPYRLDQFAHQRAPARAVFHTLDVFRPATARAIARAVGSFRPDVIHTHSVQGLSSTALARPRAHQSGRVHTMHDYWLLCQRASLVKRDGQACEQRCRSCAAISVMRNRIISRNPPDVVIAVSEAIAREHEELSWVRPRVRVIYNPVDTQTERSRRTATAGSVTFGYLGQVSVSKGVMTLIDAFRAAAIAGARLVVAGDGPMSDAVGAIAGDGVEMLGRVDGPAKEAFFQGIDCLVVPSEWKDPAPLVLNEARARGIPVIGADIGGIPELLSPISKQLLFASGDRTQLADRMTRFAVAPREYVDASVDAGGGWASHVDQIAAAYLDARQARATVA